MFGQCNLKLWNSAFVIVLFLVLAAGSALGANTAVKQLTVLGTSGTRQSAVDDALTVALGQVVVDMLTEETAVRRFQLINDTVLSRRDTYIRNYQVLTESTGHNAVTLLVRVDIAKERLGKDLAGIGLAIAGSTYPRVAFLIAEKNGDEEFVFWWGSRNQRHRTISEPAMSAALKDAGFEIVSTPSPSDPLNLSQDLSQAEILALGKRLNADIVVVGSSVAGPAANTMSGTIKAFQAEVTARAYAVKTGKPMGKANERTVASAQQASTGGHNALAKAGGSAGKKLARQIMASWRQAQEGRSVIDVMVEGTSGRIASFVKLRTAISSLSGVKELQMKEMSTDQATIAVNYQGTTRSMADALLLKTFSGFGIDIYEITPQVIRIRLIDN